MGLYRLAEAVSSRRKIIRNLIAGFRESNRNPFPRWQDSPVVVPASMAKQDEPLQMG